MLISTLVVIGAIFVVERVSGGEWLDFVMLGCDAGDAKNAAELKKRGAELSSD